MNNLPLHRQLDKIIEQCEREGRTPSLLLHCCCAPCSSAVLEYLTRHFKVTALFYNPNIYPKEEYAHRLDEFRRLVTEQPHVYEVKIMECTYEPQEFFSVARGLEAVPEGGERCRKCFMLRLGEAAKAAHDGGFDYFTTTLSISPLKNAALLYECAKAAGEKYGAVPLPSDFKKRDGYKRSIELSKEYNLYRQNYCGCIFSRNIEKF
ncbi:MAG: epoxyqueuosine reductase QueH [Clostridia bacterium]|nr:epoxyqueuosine reductase QueH [Clostridia bacterium]